MQNNKKHQGGFVGILTVLIAVAILNFIMVRGDLFGGKDIKQQKESYKEDVDAAKATKDMIEKRSEEASQ